MDWSVVYACECRIPGHPAFSLVTTQHCKQVYLEGFFQPLESSRPLRSLLWPSVLNASVWEQAGVFSIVRTQTSLTCKNALGTSPMVQGFRVCLPMQGAKVPPLVRGTGAPTSELNLVQPNKYLKRKR